MYKPLLRAIGLLAVPLCLSGQANAQPLLLQRCNADSLTIEEATDRIEWARHCALTRNVGDKSRGFVSDVTDSSGHRLIEYLEHDPNTGSASGLYTGEVFGYEINSTYAWDLFLAGPTSQSQETDGYWTWTRPRKRPRPLYPTFGTTGDLADPANKQLFPTRALGSECALYTTKDGPAAPSARTFYVNGYCEASCYTPDQKVSFQGGDFTILDALRARREDLMTLAPDATLDHPKLMMGKTDAYTAETRDTAQKVLVFKTQSGGSIAVTEEHPMINGEGRMVQAKTFAVGDELVRAGGDMDPITEIESTMYFGKVYNLRPVSEALVSNVLVAQGFLVGSSRFQNDDVGFINRTIIYHSVPDSVVP